jgi:hypothetical protein
MLLAVALIVSSVAPGLRAVAAGLVWQPGAHIAGVFDVVGPRSDGRLVVAANGGLYLLDAAGTVTRFASSYSPTPGPEAYIAISPGLTDIASGCAFARDAIAALAVGPTDPGVILISPTGQVSRLANVTGVGGLFGITMDVTGLFGHRILVVGTAPGGQTQISAIDCLGHVTTIGVVNVPLEGGIAVAPSTFGPFAGQLIAPNELDGSIYAISPAGQLATVAKSGLPFGQDIGVESLGFVPPSGPGAAYMADRATAGSLHPGNDRVLTLSGASLGSAGVGPGDLLAATEGGATVVRVRCAALCSVTSIVPVPTTAHGEGSLTMVAPATGLWTGWHPVSPAGLTSGPITFAPGSNGSLQELFAPGPHGTVWMNYELTGGTWIGWHPVSPAGLTSGPITFAPGSNGSLQELFAPGPHDTVWLSYEV